MVIIKEVKVLSNPYRKNVVVEFLESVPTKEHPEVLKARRDSKLTYEEAVKTVGMALPGIIIKADCRGYQYLPEDRTDPHAHYDLHTRMVYVEHGDDVTDLGGPMLSDKERGADSITFPAF